MTSHLGITQHQHSPQPSQTRVKYLVWFSFGEVRSLYREPLDGADVFTPIEGIGREGGIDHSDWVPVDLGPRGIFGGLCWTRDKENGATRVVGPNCIEIVVNWTQIPLPTSMNSANKGYYAGGPGWPGRLILASKGYLMSDEMI